MTANNKLPVWDLMSDQMRAVVEKSAELAPTANDTSGGFEAMRTAYTTERRYWNQGGPEMEKTTDTIVSTPAGEVAVRFHYPSTATVNPVLIYIHGGGFILGNLDTHDRIMRILANESGATVVGVDYALSPEAKFPTALYQCAWLAAHLHIEGAQYNIDPNQMGFAGDSGGALMSLASYLFLRNEIGDASYIRALLLYYGMYGLRDSVSRRLLGGSWDGLTEEDLKYYMDCYLANPDDLRSPYVDCLSADLSQVPPCFILGAELDPLLDDSAALAAILTRHGRTHTHVIYPGVIHAFLHNSRHLYAAHEALYQGACFFRGVVFGTANPQPPLIDLGDTDGFQSE